MDRITPNLWFDCNAEEAAHFYVRLFPDSRIDNIVRSPAESPSTAKGETIVVEFTLSGRLREMLESPDREAAERAMLAMLEMVKIETAALERAFSGA